MKKIIITADDYGMCLPVDIAIDDCINAGLVTTTNVILNMETANNAVMLRSRFPHISVGIHWNVTTGKPLLPIHKIPSLVNKCGEFYSIKEFKSRMRKKEISEEHLINELRAQYNAFCELCGKPDYWNTHENSALSLRAFKIFSAVAKEYGIPATRNFQRVYIDIKSVPFRRRMKEYVHRIAVDLWFGIIVRNNYVMPDARLFPFKLDSKYDTNRLFNALNSSRCKSIEIVVHPSTTSDHKFFGNLSKDRISEYEFFSKIELAELFETNGFKLINFSEINN